MPRKAAPWYRKARKMWFATIAGRQHPLNVTDPNDKEGAWEAYRRAHAGAGAKDASARNPLNPPPVSEPERRRAAAAYHDAGHAAVAARLGVPVLKLSLPVSDAGPRFFKHLADRRSDTVALGCDVERTTVQTVLVVTLAGRVAECLAGLGGVFPGGDIDDLRHALELATLMGTTHEGANAVLAQAHAEAVRLLGEPGVWLGVEFLVKGLLELGELSAEHVQSILALVPGAGTS
jgi:hypothetical protein